MFASTLESARPMVGKCTYFSRFNFAGYLDRPKVGRSNHSEMAPAIEAVYDTLWQKRGTVGDCLPFTTAFPQADLHEFLAPDVLHQIIKGTFKDHLVDWVEQFIKSEYGDRAPEILADIDRRIAVVPYFPGRRHFHEVRGFKQWTDDDSKGLIEGISPGNIGLCVATHGSSSRSTD
ncbi:hypothetical protein NP233_g1717 [Leucocoprinus birnbaumii]|uniref:Uncharacterized protein n=1 Tax=Leucocoprinus birnbaumii TaxID=56174 RepID=A0AAD5W1L0_9AGAR|nr:hypothetical protein NP233_g1717 [Leucocoprinus birnbaumii]